MKLSAKKQLENLQSEVKAYYTALCARKVVQYSTNPVIVKIDGKPSEATVKLTELSSIITTANTLGKEVRLAAGKDINGVVCVTVELVDKLPSTPSSFWVF
jgi:hypothetical protein